MKVRKITFFNHNLFGDLSLDFTEDGRTVDTIILAGENGTGKSLLLRTLFRLLNLTIERDRDDRFEVELELPHDEQGLLDKFPDSVGHGFRIRSLVRVVVDRTKTDWDQIHFMVRRDTDGAEVKLPGHLVSQEPLRPLLKVLFSDVEINFSPKNIGGVKAGELDIDVANGDKSGADLATEIAQLLVDVESQDALDFTQWAKDNLGQPVDATQIETRLKRFTNAFHGIFPTKRYKRVINAAGRKAILFEDSGRLTTLEQLSSGKKQIVFRGGFLIRNRESTRGALVLIDEPEISLHPRWQRDILQYYENLFTNEAGQQTSQIIVTTHSPFIVHNERRANDKVIVLQKNAQGQIQVAPEPTYAGWTPTEVVQRAFYLAPNAGEARVFIYTEGPTDKQYLTKAADLLGLEPSMLSLHWIGRLDERGNAVHTGKDTLDRAREMFKAQNHLLNGKHTILLYDCDANVLESDEGLLHVRSLGHEGTLGCKKGIEAMLLDHSELTLANFYSVRDKNTEDGYGGGSSIKTTQLKKQELCDHICTVMSPEAQRVVLGKLMGALSRITAGLL